MFLNRYHKQQLPTSVWAVIEDRKLVYQRKLIGKNYIKEEIESRLDYFKPDWRNAMDVAHWEEEYRYAMNNVRQNKYTILKTCFLITLYCSKGKK